MLTLEEYLKIIENRKKTLESDCKVNGADIPLLILKELLHLHQDCKTGANPYGFLNSSPIPGLEIKCILFSNDKTVEDIIQTINFSIELNPELTNLLAAYFIYFPMASLSLTNESKRSAVSPSIIEAFDILKKQQNYPRILTQKDYCSVLMPAISSEENLTKFLTTYHQLGAFGFEEIFSSWNENYQDEFIKKIKELFSSINLVISLQNLFGASWEEKNRKIICLEVLAFCMKVRPGTVEGFIASGLESCFTMLRYYEDKTSEYKKNPDPKPYFNALLVYLSNLSPSVSHTLPKEDKLALVNSLVSCDHRYFNDINLTDYFKFLFRHLSLEDIKNAIFESPFKSFRYETHHYVLRHFCYALIQEAEFNNTESIRAIMMSLFETSIHYSWNESQPTSCLALASGFSYLTKEQQNNLFGIALKTLSKFISSNDVLWVTSNCFLIIHLYAGQRTMGSERAAEVYELMTKKCPMISNQYPSDFSQLSVSAAFYPYSSIGRHFDKPLAKTLWDKYILHLSFHEIEDNRSYFFKLLATLFASMDEKDQEQQMNRILKRIISLSNIRYSIRDDHILGIERIDLHFIFILFAEIVKNNLSDNIKNFIIKRLSERFALFKDKVLTHRNDLSNIFGRSSPDSYNYLLRCDYNESFYDFILENLSKIEAHICSIEDRIVKLLSTLECTTVSIQEKVHLISKLLTLYSSMNLQQKIKFAVVVFELYEKSSLNEFKEYQGNPDLIYTLTDGTVTLGGSRLRGCYSPIIGQAVTLLSLLPSKPQAPESKTDGASIIYQEDLMSLIYTRFSSNNGDPLLKKRCDELFLAESMLESEAIPPKFFMPIFNLLFGNEGKVISEVIFRPFHNGNNNKECLINLLNNLRNAIKHKELKSIDEVSLQLFNKLNRHMADVSIKTFGYTHCQFFIGLLEMSSPKCCEVIFSSQVNGIINHHQPALHPIWIALIKKISLPEAHIKITALTELWRKNSQNLSLETNCQIASLIQQMTNSLFVDDCLKKFFENPPTVLPPALIKEPLSYLGL